MKTVAKSTKRKKTTASAATAAPEKLPYVIVRCYGAGVHAGELASVTPSCVTLRNSRRIYRWEGAMSVSELAVHGAAKPDGCKFACALERVDLLDAKEIAYCQPAGEQMIRNQPEWRFR